MESVEASGKSIEDAILQALVKLGRSRNEVEIQVMQEPSRGARGVPSREARVRVFVRPARIERSAGVVTPEMADELLEDEQFDGFEAPEAGGYAPYDDGYAEEYPATTPPDAYSEIPVEPVANLLPEDASIEEIAVEALRIILAHMRINAIVETRDGDEDDPVTLNIRGEEPNSLSLLIGRRGETLAALQLLLNTIVSKQAGSREYIIVDAEDYRQRREDNLRSMARRIADQVRRSGSPIALEAMPPAERRIIHMELADSRDISSESAGEGEQRHIVVSLKNGER